MPHLLTLTYLASMSSGDDIWHSSVEPVEYSNETACCKRSDADLAELTIRLVGYQAFSVCLLKCWQLGFAKPNSSIPTSKARHIKQDESRTGGFRKTSRRICSILRHWSAQTNQPCLLHAAALNATIEQGRRSTSVLRWPRRNFASIIPPREDQDRINEVPARWEFGSLDSIYAPMSRWSPVVHLCSKTRTFPHVLNPVILDPTPMEQKMPLPITKQDIRPRSRGIISLLGRKIGRCLINQVSCW